MRRLQNKISDNGCLKYAVLNKIIRYVISFGYSKLCDVRCLPIYALKIYTFSEYEEESIYKVNGTIQNNPKTL